MTRPRFGEGDLALDPSKSVFINCPFDADYAPLFDAIVFSAVCCGFMPRSALESGTVSEPRLHRILRAMFNSKYSIHDLSRCVGEGSGNTARFNMPLELGMAMARRFLDGGDGHDWLVLVPKGHAYTRFVSDLAGYDPVSHNGSIPGVVMAVMSWLAIRVDAEPLAEHQEVLQLLPAFQQSKAALDESWNGYAPWADIVMAAVKVARKLA